jgi:hypothetical protein
MFFCRDWFDAAEASTLIPVRSISSSPARLLSYRQKQIAFPQFFEKFCKIAGINRTSFS